jgi:hypothetical protein
MNSGCRKAFAFCVLVTTISYCSITRLAENSNKRQNEKKKRVVGGLLHFPFFGDFNDEEDHEGNDDERYQRH